MNISKTRLDQTRLDKSLDENIDELLRDENPTAEAVKSLINVKEKESGKNSEVELKTDLTDDEIKIHTVLAVLSNLVEMNAEQFNEKCILSEVIEKKERKALSKDRKSRLEIVEVARHPDMNMMTGMPEDKSFIKRFFGSKRNQQPPQ